VIQDVVSAPKSEAKKELLTQLCNKIIRLEETNQQLLMQILDKLEDKKLNQTRKYALPNPASSVIELEALVENTDMVKL